MRKQNSSSNGGARPPHPKPKPSPRGAALVVIGVRLLFCKPMKRPFSKRPSKRKDGLQSNACHRPKACTVTDCVQASVLEVRGGLAGSQGTEAVSGAPARPILTTQQRVSFAWTSTYDSQTSRLLRFLAPEASAPVVWVRAGRLAWSKSCQQRPHTPCPDHTATGELRMDGQTNSQVRRTGCCHTCCARGGCTSGPPPIRFVRRLACSFVCCTPAGYMLGRAAERTTMTRSACACIPRLQATEASL